MITISNILGTLAIFYLYPLEGREVTIYGGYEGEINVSYVDNDNLPAEIKEKLIEAGWHMYTAPGNSHTWWI